MGAVIMPVGYGSGDGYGDGDGNGGCDGYGENLRSRPVPRSPWLGVPSGDARVLGFRSRCSLSCDVAPLRADIDCYL